MAIEQFFRCPRTLAKLRSGALCNFLEGFCLWLLKAGFSRSCIRRHRVNVSHLNRFLGGAGAPPRPTVGAQDVTAFFDAYPAYCRHRGPLQAHLENVHASFCPRGDSRLRSERRSISRCSTTTWNGCACKAVRHRTPASYVGTRSSRSFAGWDHGRRPKAWPS